MGHPAFVATLREIHGPAGENAGLRDDAVAKVFDVSGEYSS